MVRPSRPCAGQYSATPQDGVFMSAQQLLDLVKNAQASGPIPEPTHPRSGFARLCGDYNRFGWKAIQGIRECYRNSSLAQIMRSHLFSHEPY